jgi:hypothetical protein
VRVSFDKVLMQLAFDPLSNNREVEQKDLRLPPMLQFLKVLRKAQISGCLNTYPSDT